MNVANIFRKWWGIIAIFLIPVYAASNYYYDMDSDMSKSGSMY